MSRKNDKRSKGNRVAFTMCAVETCACVATQKHHYIPWRFLPDNSFVLQLCEDHHKMVDDILSKIDICTPLKFFKIMFEFIYGRGTAYKQLVVNKDSLNEPRTTVHYISGGRSVSDDDVGTDEVQILQ